MTGWDECNNVSGSDGGGEAKRNICISFLICVLLDFFTFCVLFPVQLLCVVVVFCFYITKCLCFYVFCVLYVGGFAQLRPTAEARASVAAQPYILKCVMDNFLAFSCVSVFVND